MTPEPQEKPTPGLDIGESINSLKTDVKKIYSMFDQLNRNIMNTPVTPEKDQTIEEIAKELF